MITNFAELIETAKNQPEPQRLLFLFAKAHEETMPNGEIGGTISATMCVDKLPEELSSFETFVAEADSISKEWDFIFIAGLPGIDGEAPTSEEADKHLNQMTNNIMSGQGINQYMVFDRNDHPVEIQPNEA